MTGSSEHPPGRGRRATARAAAWLLGAALAGCTAAPPPRAPSGSAADFDAPRPALVASLLGAASHRESRGDLEGALNAAEQAHDAAPASGAAALREAELRAAVARRAGDATGLTEARVAIQGIADQHPDAPAPKLALARLALAEGDPDAAEASARALVEARPDWAPPHALLARVLLEKDPPRALELATRAVELAPSDPDALGARASAHAALGRDQAASDDARRALLLRADPDLVRILARSRIRSGDPAGAIRQIEAVIDAERTVALELLLARADLALGKLDAARDALVRAKTLAGDDLDAQVDAIELSTDLALIAKRPGDALAEIEAARAAGPDDARLAELAALVELELGRLPQAEADARRSVELAPERLASWQSLARVLERAGARVPAFERARIAFGGQDARAHALAAVIAEQSGDPAAARNEYEAALAGDPELAIAELGLAIQLAESDPPRALALAERARERMGFTIATAQALGTALWANQRHAEAVSAFRIALAKTEPGSPASGPVQLGLATALAAAGEEAEARAIASGLIAAGRGLDPAPAWLGPAQELRNELLAEAEPAAKAKPAPEPTPAPPGPSPGPEAGGTP